MPKFLSYFNHSFNINARLSPSPSSFTAAYPFSKMPRTRMGDSLDPPPPFSASFVAILLMSSSRRSTPTRVSESLLPGHERNYGFRRVCTLSPDRRVCRVSRLSVCDGVCRAPRVPCTTSSHLGTQKARSTALALHHSLVAISVAPGTWRQGWTAIKQLHLNIKSPRASPTRRFRAVRVRHASIRPREVQPQGNLIPSIRLYQRGLPDRGLIQASW